MQIWIFYSMVAYLIAVTAGNTSTWVSDVIPYFTHPGQGSHTRLGGSHHQAGLLYQQSPITIRLTADTVVLWQEVNFDILNKKMATLNEFQHSVTDKVQSLQNTSALSLRPLQSLYSIEPQVILLRNQ